MNRILRGFVIAFMMCALLVSGSQTSAKQEVRKRPLEIKYATKKFVIAAGRAKISFKSLAKQIVTVRIYDSKGKLVATLPKTSCNAKTTKSVYWNGRRRVEGEMTPGDYISSGFYRAKVTGTSGSVLSGKIQAQNGAKQVISKVATTTRGFIGEKSVQISFCVSKKQDVFVRILNKAGKTAFLKKMRDVKSKKVVKLILSGRASAENQLGLEGNELLKAGDYSIKISSNGATCVRKIRLLKHFARVNQFNVNQDGATYIATWGSIEDAVSYEVRVCSLVTQRIQVIKDGMGAFEDQVVCNLSSFLVGVGEYDLELYATGDAYHPRTKVGVFSYSVLGKLEAPKRVMFIENNKLISAYCDPVSNADAYEIQVFFNGVLSKTFEAEGSSKYDVTQVVRENGFGEYTFQMKAKSKSNSCYSDSEFVLSDTYSFTGNKTPTDLTVTKDAVGAYTAHWTGIEGVNYYCINLFVNGVRESTVVSASNKATITEFVPQKGVKYQLEIYSLGNETHGESLPSALFDFVA